MKKSVLRFPSSSMLIALLRLTSRLLSVFIGVNLWLLFVFSSTVHASPQPSNDVHFCLPLDTEDMRTRDSIYAATKHALNLNVGEPRTVRMIYFLPNDRPFRQEVVDSIKVTIRQIQTFYAEQMQAHGYGNKTFRFETDAQSEPMIHRVDGQHPDSHYLDNTYRRVLDELEPRFDVTKNIYFIAIDNSIDAIGSGGNRVEGVGVRRGKNGGYALFPGKFSRKGASWRVTVHELGHAFGLLHDFRDDSYIMSYGVDSDSLSQCSADFLAVHPYFNPDIAVLEASPPTIELISPTKYPAGSKNVTIQLKVSDPEELHQIILFVTTRSLFISRSLEVKACRRLAGTKDAVVEFDYDGVIPSGASFYDLSNPSVHPISIDAIDTDGNVSRVSFHLWEISSQHIATLEEGYTTSVAFSPNGSTLASGGALDKTVKLWDVVTRQNIATLKHTAIVNSVAFSPDGSILASGSFDKIVKLWDVATRANIVTLKHTAIVNSVAFSPDGSMLAFGSFEGVKLWDVASQINIATLAHENSVESVVFSPNGKTIATGSWGGNSSVDAAAVRLWDVATREIIATLEEHNGRVNSVVFSPDGKTLASGSDDETVKLWDVATRTNIATLEGHRSSVRSVAFSPDGSILVSGSEDNVSGSWDNSVKLWDIATRQNIETYRHIDNISSTYNSPWIADQPSGQAQPVYSVVFSPDGTTLASGAGSPIDGNGTVILWDASEWMRRRPQTLVKISGDNQQGPLGVELVNLFSIEVRDQNGNVLEGTQVTFTVITGDGSLSGKFTVENIMTDANGRAQITLTLGPNPGTNTVKASVAGLVTKIEVTFNAMGIGTPTTPIVDGDYRIWHLPDGAIVRLGKGSISEHDKAVAFSPDGQRLAVASGIGIWLYDVATLRELVLLTGHTGRAEAVAFSPDGTTLVSGANDGMLKLWDVETGANIATLGGDNRTWQQSVQSVAFSPDGTTLAAGSYGKVNLWDVPTKTNITTLEGHTKWVSSVAFSPDGTTLASGLNDDKVELWDIATKTNIATLIHMGLVQSVAFSPDGTTLASGASLTVKLWDIATRTNVATLRNTGGAVAFSPDGTTLATRQNLWDVAKREKIATFEGPASSMVFSPDGTMLASGAGDGTVRLWDIATQNSVTIRHSNGVRTVAFSPDSATLAYPVGRSVRLWDVATQTTVAILDKVWPESIAFSPDSATLAVGGHLWDVTTRENIITLEGRADFATFSPDGKTLAGSDANIVKLWDVATGKNIAILEGHTGGFNMGRVEALAFSPDGTTLASGSRDNTVRLWNIATRTTIAILEHTGFVESIAFSPDGTILAYGSRNRTVKLWDVAARENIATLWHNTEILSVAFSPDGTTLASGSADGPVLLWDVATREHIATLDGHTEWVWSVAFSPDGTTIASGSSDGTVLLWDMSALGLGGSSQDAFSLSLDGDVTAGDQAVTSLDVSPGSVVSLQVFGENIQDAEGFSIRFEYDATQVLYEGFDPGSVLPNVQVLSVPGTNPTAIEIWIASFGGKAVADSGLVGSIRFRTTSAFSGTTLRLMRAELGRGEERERITFDNTGVTLQLAALTPDFNGDGRVDLDDFLLFVEHLGFSRGDEGYDAKYDLNEDGVIGFGDFLIFAKSFGDGG